MYRVDINEYKWYKFQPEKGFTLVTLREMVVFGKKTEEFYEELKCIANFWVHVVNQVEVNNNGIIDLFAEVILIFADGSEDGTKSEPMVIPLKDLEKRNWANDIDLRCFLYPDVAKAGEYIANMIRTSCYKAPQKKTTVIDRLGTHTIEGVPVFCKGDGLIWPAGLENKPSVKWSPIPNNRLAIDPNCSERDAEVGMMRIIDLSLESGRIIFAFNMLNVMREAFIASGKTPRSMVFVHGLTGMKKTTYTNFQSHIYNRDKPLESPPRLNSSIPAAVKILYEKSDCVIVLDDLYPAQDSESRRQQEKLFFEIARIIGDGVEPARMRGQQVAKAPSRCGVLSTGEYYTGIGSNASRLFPVKMSVPIDNDKLTACQKEPLILSTFYNYFIQWYITNYDKICGLLKEWLDAYLNTKSSVHDRLQETQFFLEAAYKIFLTYRIDKGFITPEVAQEQYNSFYHQLRAIVKEQNVRASRNKNIKLDIDYLALIRKLYHDKQFALVRSAKDFEAKAHDGIIHKDHIYFRRDRLLKKLRVYEPSAEFDDALENLKMQQAIKTGRHSDSKQLHGGKHNPRLYAIKLAKLV